MTVKQCTEPRLSARELLALTPAERAAVIATRKAFEGVAVLGQAYRAAGYVSVGRTVQRAGR